MVKVMDKDEISKTVCPGQLVSESPTLSSDHLNVQSSHVLRGEIFGRVGGGFSLEESKD